MLKFQTDILIRGKKAEKIQELKVKYDFELVDIYMIAAVIGFLNNAKDINENDSDATANLPRTVLNNRQHKIDFLCEIMTLHNEIDNDAESAIKLAFEESKIDNSNNKMYKKELFHDYAMGGIEILYQMLANVEYDNQVENLKNILEKYNNDEYMTSQSLEEILNNQGF